MISCTEEIQTYCAICFVLMAYGTIKLMVRPSRPLMFENRMAKIFIHNQRSKGLRGPSKTKNTYRKMVIFSDSAVLHNNEKLAICKHCLNRITSQGPVPFSAAHSWINPASPLKENMQHIYLPNSIWESIVKKKCYPLINLCITIPENKWILRFDSVWGSNSSKLSQI